MRIIFEQKRRLNSRKYILTDTKLVVETKSITKNFKYELKLDAVGNQILYQSDSTILGKITFYICLAIPFIAIILFLCSFKIEIRLVLINCLIWWGLALYNFLTLHNDDIFITGGHQNLAFYRTIPNEETVLEFVEKIISTSKKYLKEKYTKVELSMSEEAFFSQLRWLQEREVITDLELKELMNEYRFSKLI